MFRIFFTLIYYSRLISLLVQKRPEDFFSGKGKTEGFWSGEHQAQLRRCCSREKGGLNESDVW